MNVVDSSAWLEYFTDAGNARLYAAAIENTARLIVPSITLFEVYKRSLQQRGEDPALEAVAAMRQGRVVDLDERTAIEAAKLSDAMKLPLAGSVILATARRYRAVLWTQDADFKGMAGVKYFASK
jgi:predicted nucleic acid-binding protein